MVKRIYLLIILILIAFFLIPAVSHASGSWVTSSTIDSAGNVGGCTSIAVDSNNKVHISYQDFTYHDLKYATNASGSWVTSIIDSAGGVGLYSSIAVDSNNKVHISYYNEFNNETKGIQV